MCTSTIYIYIYHIYHIYIHANIQSSKTIGTTKHIHRSESIDGEPLRKVRWICFRGNDKPRHPREFAPWILSRWKRIQQFKSLTDSFFAICCAHFLWTCELKSCNSESCDLAMRKESWTMVVMSQHPGRM